MQRELAPHEVAAARGLPQPKDIVMTKRGLVLVVGATGSGKSTSLAAMLDHRNRSSAGHIITVEDPVEFVQKKRAEAKHQAEREDPGSHDDFGVGERGR